MNKIDQLAVKFQDQGSNIQLYNELEGIRIQFVEKFTLQFIRNMNIEDYVLGRTYSTGLNRDGFCYWLEWGTDKIGRIQGSPAIKYGVYVEKKTQQYKYKKRYYSPSNTFEDIKKEIVKCIEYGESKNYKVIEEVDLPTTIKGKILFLYYPDKYLNIFSKRYLNQFVMDLGIEDIIIERSVLEKGKLLLRLKNNSEVMNKWTVYQFTDFLYKTFGNPKDKLPSK